MFYHAVVARLQRAGAAAQEAPRPRRREGRGHGPHPAASPLAGAAGAGAVLHWLSRSSEGVSARDVGNLQPLGRLSPNGSLFPVFVWDSISNSIVDCCQMAEASWDLVFHRLVCPDLIPVQYSDFSSSTVDISPLIQVFPRYSAEVFQFPWCFAHFFLVFFPGSFCCCFGLFALPNGLLLCPRILWGLVCGSMWSLR